MSVYGMLHSPVCRIVQMWNSANTAARTKHIWVACFLLWTHLDYIFRTPLDFLGYWSQKIDVMSKATPASPLFQGQFAAASQFWGNQSNAALDSQLSMYNFIKASGRQNFSQTRNPRLWSGIWQPVLWQGRCWIRLHRALFYRRPCQDRSWAHFDPVSPKALCGRLIRCKKFRDSALKAIIKML